MLQSYFILFLHAFSIFYLKTNNSINKTTLNQTKKSHHGHRTPNSTPNIMQRATHSLDGQRNETTHNKKNLPNPLKPNLNETERLCMCACRVYLSIDVVNNRKKTNRKWPQSNKKSQILCACVCARVVSSVRAT